MQRAVVCIIVILVGLINCDSFILLRIFALGP